MFEAAGSAQGLFVGTVHDWAPEPGQNRFLGSRRPPPWRRPRQAPISDVPLSAMQEAHLRGFSRYAAEGLDYARLVIGSGDEPGRCDIRVMSYVINSHLRRHKTYHSWFEYTNTRDFVRHTIGDPADIDFIPVRHQEMTPSEWQRFVLSTLIRCSGIASGSASFSARTTSHSFRLSITCTATRRSFPGCTPRS